MNYRRRTTPWRPAIEGLEKRWAMAAGSAAGSVGPDGLLYSPIPATWNDTINNAVDVAETGGRFESSVGTDGGFTKPWGSWPDNDVDMYRISLKAGVTLSVDALSDVPRSGPGFNSYLRLFDSAGQQLAANDNNGLIVNGYPSLDSSLRYTTSTAQTLYVGVSGSGNAEYSPWVIGSGVRGDVGHYWVRIDATPPRPLTGFVYSAVSPGDYTFITFGRPIVGGFGIEDITLKRNGQSLDLSAATLTTTGGWTYRIGNLAGLVAPTGDYTMTVNAANSGIVDIYGLSLSQSFGLSWHVDPPAEFLPALLDKDLRRQAWDLSRDGAIDRQDMIGLLRSTASDDGIVDAGEIGGLRVLLDNAASLRIPQYVTALAKSVVCGSPANQTFQQKPLGNLVAGSTAATLQTLVDKWFFGADRPFADGNSYRPAGGQLFVNGPSYLDMRQGQVGDCYFIATMGSLATSAPASISSMFIANGDNTWTVRFYAAAGATYVADYVTVDNWLPTSARGLFVYANNGAVCSSTANELWMPLVEKAYVQWNETGRAGRQVVTNAYQSIAGGWMFNVAAQVLGTPADTYWGFQDSYKAMCVAALQFGKSVTIGTARTGDGLFGSHAYQVVGYNPVTDRFQLYNPWGGSHPAPLSWEQLRRNCSCFVVANATGAAVVRVQAIPSNAREPIATAVFAAIGSAGSDCEQTTTRSRVTRIA